MSKFSKVILSVAVIVSCALGLASCDEVYSFKSGSGGNVPNSDQDPNPCINDGQNVDDFNKCTDAKTGKSEGRCINGACIQVVTEECKEDENKIHRNGELLYKCDNQDNPVATCGTDAETCEVCDINSGNCNTGQHECTEDDIKCNNPITPEECTQDQIKLVESADSQSYTCKELVETCEGNDTKLCRMDSVDGILGQCINSNCSPKCRLDEDDINTCIQCDNDSCSEGGSEETDTCEDKTDFMQCNSGRGLCYQNYCYKINDNNQTKCSADPFIIYKKEQDDNSVYKLCSDGKSKEIHCNNIGCCIVDEDNKHAICGSDVDGYRCSDDYWCIKSKGCEDQNGEWLWNGCIDNNNNCIQEGYQCDGSNNTCYHTKCRKNCQTPSMNIHINDCLDDHSDYSDPDFNICSHVTTVGKKICFSEDECKNEVFPNNPELCTPEGGSGEAPSNKCAGIDYFKNCKTVPNIDNYNGLCFQGECREVDTSGNNQVQRCDSNKLYLSGSNLNACINDKPEPVANCLNKNHCCSIYASDFDLCGADDNENNNHDYMCLNHECKQVSDSCSSGSNNDICVLNSEYGQCNSSNVCNIRFSKDGNNNNNYKTGCYDNNKDWKTWGCIYQPTQDTQKCYNENDNDKMQYCLRGRMTINSSSCSNSSYPVKHQDANGNTFCVSCKECAQMDNCYITDCSICKDYVGIQQIYNASENQLKCKEDGKTSKCQVYDVGVVICAPPQYSQG